MNKQLSFLQFLLAGFFAIFCAAGSHSQTCTGNLLTNPGFENGLTGWNTTGTVTVSTSANTGSKAAKIGGAGYASAGFILPTTPGTAYTSKVWAKYTGNSYRVVELRFLNSSYTTLPGAAQAEPATTSYTEYILNGTAPAGAAYVYVIASKDGNGSIEVDDWCLTTGGGGNLPDLQFSGGVSISGPPSPIQPGQNLFYQYYLANLGNGAANGSFNVKTWISTDQALSADDTPAGTPQPFSNIAANTFLQVFTVTLTLPNLPNGTYYLLVKADADDQIAEGNEDNNVAVSFNTFTVSNGSGLPDLVLSGDIAGTLPGGELAFIYYLSNQGNVAINLNYTVKAWISNDQALSATDIPAGTVGSWGNTPANWFYQAYASTLTLPANLAPGQYYLIFKADADDQVVESNEINNLLVSSPFTVSGGGGKIDLSLTLQQTPAAPIQWNNYTVKATVSNAGPQAATGVKVSFKKPNGVVYTGGNEWTASQGTFTPFGNEEWTVGSIPVNGSATLTVSYFLLQPQAPVAYAQVSAANQTDSDSQPNNGTPPTPVQDDEASTISIPPNLTPDLTIADLQIPNPSVAVGAILNYNFDLSNIGTAAVPGNFTVKSYLSTDNVLSANDVQDGTIPTGNYGAGLVVNNVAGASTIPANLAPGNYYLIVKVDADGQVAESNENNNVVSAPFTVTGGGSLPDFEFHSFGVIQLLPGGAQVIPPNGTITAGTSIAAIDHFATGTFFSLQTYQYTVTMRLSTDAVFDAGDYLVMSQALQFTPLSPTYVGLVSEGGLGQGIIPANTPPGNYYLIVKYDANGEVAESNENNNIRQLPIVVVGGGNPCNAITITPGTGKITIAGATAPHVLIKVFRPNWTLAFECLDNCGNPQVVSGLSAGTHHVQVKLINSGWGEICYLQQDVNVSSFGGNGNSALKINNDRQRLAFDKIYPNPAQYWVTLEIYSKEDQEAVLDFYDATGRPVHRLEVQLNEGRTGVELDVSQWKSGAYNVIGRGNGMPAYGRFLKVWEE